MQQFAPIAGVNSNKYPLSNLDRMNEVERFRARQRMQARVIPYNGRQGQEDDRTRKISMQWKQKHLSMPATAPASPLPYESGVSMFNAFDYMSAPEAFSNNNDGNNNQQHQEELEMHFHHHRDSLWRRRFHTQGEPRKSPKIGQGALWDWDASMAAKAATTLEKPLDSTSWSNQWNHQHHYHYAYEKSDMMSSPSTNQLWE